MPLKVQQLCNPRSPFAGEKKGKKMGSNFRTLLKTDVEKMSAFRLAKMLMKIKSVSQNPVY
jgi:hypothetical protein